METHNSPACGLQAVDLRMESCTPQYDLQWEPVRTGNLAVHKHSACTLSSACGRQFTGSLDGKSPDIA